MPLAKEVAAELRKLADSLDKEPETMVRQVRIGFWYEDQKEDFLNLVRLLPRPLAKEYPKSPGAFERIYVKHTTPSMEVFATIYQSNVCTLIEPAKPAVYECEPLLSLETISA